MFLEQYECEVYNFYETSVVFSEYLTPPSLASSSLDDHNVSKGANFSSLKNLGQHIFQKITTPPELLNLPINIQVYTVSAFQR